MSRVPPSLLYLTVYNPTLRHTGPIVGDDEDADEQAQILFYTARERAVSRDKILRQVGLVKALVNFTGMFSPSDMCENTHSQSRRMVMVSPEPNFWFHACVELAKSPRPPPPAKGKGKGKGKASATQEVAYDYYDSSVHDLALRTRIVHGYEQFKLTHGSFTSILASLGQQALEVQLERFFTVWAWSWDFEEDMDFAGHLGVPLHPLHRSLSPILDVFSQERLETFVTFLLIPPFVVPSTKLIESGYPSVLISHILSRIPPPPPPTNKSTDSKPYNAEEKPAADLAVPRTLNTKSLNDTIRTASPFMNMNMDMRSLKWMWNGLTFSKTSSAKPTAPSSPSIAATEEHAQEPLPSQEAKMQETLVVPQRPEAEVDAESLQEAISSDFEGTMSHVPSPTKPEAIPLPASPPSSPPDICDVEATRGDDGTAELENTPRIAFAFRADGIQAFPEVSNIANPHNSVLEERPATPVPQPDFISTIVYLATGANPEQTVRHRVYHATQGIVTFGVIAEDGNSLDLSLIANALVGLFSKLEDVVEEGEKRTDDVATPVTKILEPQSKHIICTGGYTFSSSPSFSSKSEHLFNGRERLHSEFDIQEVFSRSQNPQHWHISKRSLGVNQDGNMVDGQVFMEVARKESTLADVDNELTGAVRRFLE
ncbi:uncharacterized protein PHACADRAFT_213358 [Phanerochaete carnosa HHB-10118-sp]|uniref:CCZ1/INTU/HSP4 first Longin domain-containing protein n=1 Tax=Phanerochaete carnosa (strain HHB-10118-sp) TaxID=650164 RepID=K5VV39_PHACS|nr:uncharacterized protein PHACADRAFT_213358 [Phanerochaete carnosa HHB-10118-sp]EKM50434.1 hypothetical protein PHACADRAFT_213358 [Phanerochaete carnosa HHB-10118-sp]